MAQHPATTSERAVATERMIEPGLGARLRINARVIQILLGLIWILDGALQYQPYMFGKGFVNGVILPNAHGQPAPITWFITNVAHLMLPHVGVWNFLFATLQLAIGVGLLFRRTLKPALTVMIVWSFGVWVLGEGVGMLLTGTASPLMGAPGAVLIYAVIGVLVWPRSVSTATARQDDEQKRVGIASSAGATGPFGNGAALAAWAVLWVGFALLWLLPANRAAGSISSAISGMASGEPGWYAHFLTTFAAHFSSISPQTAWVLAIASLVIGLGPLLSGRPSKFLVAGAVLGLAYWATGMAFGGIMTGTGTDPNCGPLIVLLALALLPTVEPVRASDGRPFVAMVRVNPITTSGVALSVFAVLLLSATYPVAASASSASSAPSVSPTASTTGSGGAMSGMSMSSGAADHSGGGAKKAMNMSAMAGLDVTASDWKYTGPPLPAAEVNELVTSSDEQDKGHEMQTPNCTTTPTSQQILGATQYVQAVSAAVSKYRDLSAATAAGYVPITTTDYPVVHYLNFRYMNRQDIMNPNEVDSLVYATTPYGPVLVAAMFLMPGSGNGPMPYGCLVQWHAHTNLCSSDITHQIDGLQPCRAGSTPDPTTPFMTHVWQVPVAGGPLAIDPSDLQVVEAAIMAQQDGSAPTTTGAPPSIDTAAAFGG